MSLITEKTLINLEIAFIKNLFLSTVNLIPSFDITNPKILPYGLRPHTRSISWIAEQVITQQTKFNAKKLGIDDLDFDVPRNYLHNVILRKDEKAYFVKVKVHLGKGKYYKNTIAPTAKTFMQYKSNHNYRLIYATFGINYQNQIVTFENHLLNVFSSQFLPFSISPKTDKIKAFFQHKPVYRTRNEFLNLLAEKSVAITIN